MKLPVTLLLDDVSGEANVGSIFRLADAFNIEKIIFGGFQPNFSSNRLKKTARNTHKYIAFECVENPVNTITDYKGMGYMVYCLEITNDSVPLHSVSFEPDKKILLVAGNEKTGISEEILRLSNKIVHIPMYGKNSSMNIAQATGIALYEISKSLFPLNKK